jgi:hypothetical protein
VALGDGTLVLLDLAPLGDELLWCEAGWHFLAIVLRK